MRPMHSGGNKQGGNGNGPNGGRITHLLANPWDHSAWVANHAWARQILPDSSIGHELLVQTGAPAQHPEHLALYADIDAPSVFITEPEADSFTNDNTPTIHLSYQDIGSGVDGKSIRLTLDDAPLAANCVPELLTALCTPVLPLADGYLHLLAYVADYAFNESEPDEQWFTVDTIAPVIHLDPVDTLTNRPALSLRGTVEELHLATLTINDQPVTVDAQHAFAFTTTLVEGENQFTLYARDLAGNESSLTRTITLDTVPPELTVFSPADNLVTNQNTATLAGAVNEPATVALNGYPLTLDKTQAFSTTRDLQEGQNAFALQATDLAGNQTHAYRTVTLDTTPPPAPNPGRIRVSEPDADGTITITGLPGSVAPNSWVTITIGDDGTARLAPGEPNPGIFNCTPQSHRVQADQFGGFVLRLQPGGTVCPIIIGTEDPGGNHGGTTTISTDTPPETRTGVVGALPGEFSVDPTGAANYRVPIAVPPGVGGMQPELAFLYSSRAGNGQLGVGWSLSGLSAITRCGQTFAQDGKRLGVTLSENDRFCLDGQRLIQVPGTERYYRTEIESFQKVEALGGSAAAGPANFKVLDKAGLIRTYGTGSATFNAQGTNIPLVWLVNKIEDRFGNYIAFEYGTTSRDIGGEIVEFGEYWPKRIAWYNATGALIGQVKFSYEARNDERGGFMFGGSRSALTKRLKTVSTWSGTTKVFEYRLGYEYGDTTGFSQLRTIRQCAANGECLPPTTFNWQQGQDGVGREVQHFGALRDIEGKFGDVDGDGRLDVIDTDAGWIRLTTAKSGTPVRNIRLPLWDVGDSDISAIFDEAVLGNARVTDVNGDGYSDIIIPAFSNFSTPSYWGKSRWNVFLSNGTKFESAPSTAVGHVEDNWQVFDWDKARDPQPILPLDLNGDGRQDIITRVNGKLAIIKQTASGFSAPAISDYPLEIEQEIMLIEFNGDGVPDILVTSEGCDAAGSTLAPSVRIIDIPNDEPGGGGGGGGDNEPALTCADTAGIFVTLGNQLVPDQGVDRCDANNTVAPLADTSGDEQNIYPIEDPPYFPPGTTDPCAGQFGSNLSIDDPLPTDINGDGLTDLAFVPNHGSYWKLLINKGAWFVTSSWAGASDENADRAQVVDFNRDGKQDLIIPQSGDFKYFESTGTGFKRAVSAGLPTSTDFSTLFMDMTGDGQFDEVYYTDRWLYRPHRGSKPDLLTDITNGFGEQTVIGYGALSADPTHQLYLGHTASGIENASLHEPQVRDFLGPIYVVHSFGADSGATTGNSLLYTRYTYKGAKLSQWGRGFLGFYEVTATNLNTSIETINRHRQDFPFTGMVMESIQRTPDRMLQTFNNDDLRGGIVCPRPIPGPRPGPGGPGPGDEQLPLAPSALPDGCEFNPPPEPEIIEGQLISQTTNTFARFSWDGRQFPYVQQSVSVQKDLNSGVTLKRTTTHYTYDSNGAGGTWGNPTAITVTVDDGHSGQRHVTRTVNQYTNEGTNWCLGRLTQATVTQTLPSGASASRTSSFTYAQTSGATGLKTCQLDSETVAPATAAWLTKTYGFDAFGNRTSVTVTGADIAPRTTRTTYDTQGLYPRTITNALAHSETQTWDARFGVKTKVIGPNGLPTTWGYDAFGRQIAMHAPRAAVDTTYVYSWCNNTACISQDAVWQLAQKGSDGSLSLTAYDRLGRKVMTGALDVQGRMVQQATVYDIKGRPYLSSQPYFANQSSSACWAYRQYDNLDRVLADYQPASANQCASVRILDAASGAPLVDADTPPAYGAITRYAYAGLTTYVSDPQGRTVSKTHNVMDRLVQVAERNPTTNLSLTNLPGVLSVNGVAVQTTYAYTPFGDTQTVTDAKGNTTRMRYNARGFKIGMDDPDMGSWIYTHNALGELISQTDAKGQTVQLTYDALGRMIQRTEAEGQTTWTYDSAPGKGIGKLAQVSFTPAGDTVPAFAKAHAYAGEGGELTATVQIMGGRAYWTSQSYDPLGRPQTLTYPATDAPAVSLSQAPDGSAGGIPVVRPADDDAFHVTYAYTRSVLTAVTDDTGVAIWQLGQSDAAGRVTTAVLGNNLTSTYAYDQARGVLTGIRTGQGASTAIQNLRYQWDLAGNLTRRQNHALGQTDVFGYDALYRLARVERQFPAALPLAGEGTASSPAPLIKGADSGTAAGGGFSSATPVGATATSRFLTGCTNSATVSCFAYDAIGNLLAKGNTYSGYAYGTASGRLPHAVRAVTVHRDGTSQTQNYTYDANGNLIEGGGNTVTWASYNKPIEITDTATGYSSAFAYGPDRARYWQYAQTAQGPVTTWYVGTAYERVTEATGAQHRYFIRAGGQVIAVHKVQEAASSTPFAPSGTSSTPSPLTGEGRGEGELSSSPAPFAKGAAGTAGGFSLTALADPDANGIWTEYLHRDHQGSIVAITSQTGELLARFQYDAWGQRRAAVDLSGNPGGFSTLNTFTARGYTGHEHLHHVGLIHMNGRVYDPAIGRFLSADIAVQFPASTQSWNRYTYVNNNPMSFTDPSGFFSWSKFRDKWLKPIVAIVATVITYGAVSGYLATAGWTSFWAGVGAGATAGFIGGGIATGTLEGAFKGAVTGAIFGGISGHYQNAWSWSRVLANSTAGGISAEIAGGEFKDGFKIVFAVSLMRMGWEYMREQTNMLKMRSFENGGDPVKYNKWGEPLTDGTRNVTYGMDSNGQLFTKAENNWFTQSGMEAEGSGFHVYSENSWTGRWVNWTSKTHDFMNSWGYSETGFWVSRSELYNTVFQAYSMAGMAPAFAFTTAAMSATIPTPLILHASCRNSPNDC